jgi:hypothetical protein
MRYCCTLVSPRNKDCAPCPAILADHRESALPYVGGLLELMSVCTDVSGAEWIINRISRMVLHSTKQFCRQGSGSSASWQQSRVVRSCLQTSTCSWEFSEPSFSLELWHLEATTDINRCPHLSQTLLWALQCQHGEGQCSILTQLTHTYWAPPWGACWIFREQRPIVSTTSLCLARGADKCIPVWCQSWEQLPGCQWSQRTSIQSNWGVGTRPGRGSWRALPNWDQKDKKV